MKGKTKVRARKKALEKYMSSKEGYIEVKESMAFSTGFNMGWDIARKKIEKKNDNPFTEKCICDWSKDNEYGFIPNTECPVHGKATMESLKRTVPYHYSERDKLGKGYTYGIGKEAIKRLRGNLK